MLNGLTYVNGHKECMTSKDVSRSIFLTIKSFAHSSVVRNAKAKNYAENIK